MVTRKQDNQLKSYLAPAIIAAIITLLSNLVTYAVTNPVNRITRLEDDVNAIKVSQAAREENIKSIKESLVKLEAGQILSNSKIDNLTSEVVSLRRK